MRFENAFDVEAPPEEVYATLLDVERVAPCVPGAQVLEHSGENAYKVAIKVKVGPIQMQYRGDVEIVERDEAQRRAVMRAKARETRGQGTANATVETRVEARDGNASHGTMVADVQLSGRAAAMGRGMIEDVSARLVQQFAENLAAMLSGAPAAAPEAAPAAPPPPEAAAPPPPPPPPRAVPAPEPEPLDVGALAGSMLARRLRDPRVVGGLVALLALVAFLVGRRTARS